MIVDRAERQPRMTLRSDIASGHSAAVLPLNCAGSAAQKKNPLETKAKSCVGVLAAGECVAVGETSAGQSEHRVRRVRLLGVRLGYGVEDAGSFSKLNATTLWR